MTASPTFDKAEVSSQLCSELLRLGGIHAAFAGFLRWRGDLLPPDEVAAFRRARETVPVSRTYFIRTIREELGSIGDVLVKNLEPEPCWSSLARCAYVSKLHGRRVVVQVANQPVSTRALHDFQRDLGKLPEIRDLGLAAPPVLRKFREWLHLADDPARERRYLEAADRIRQTTSFLWPEAVREACAGPVLCWFLPEGTPLSVRLSSDPSLAGRLAELVLEQTCMLGLIEGDLDLDSIFVAADGRLAVCRWNRVISLPQALMPSVLRYFSSVISDDSPLAARMLVRLAYGRPVSRLEPVLLKELANCTPQMRRRLRLPPSAIAFEDNWRALANINPQAPLYLDCLHRNVHLLGYCFAETAPDVNSDPIADSQLAVLGRLLRHRARNLATADTAQKWIFGSAVLFEETLKQFGRMAEGLHTQDPSVAVDLAPEPAIPENPGNAARSVVLAAILLVAFLACLHWVNVAEAPWRITAAALAALAFAGLTWVMIRR